MRDEPLDLKLGALSATAALVGRHLARQSRACATPKPDCPVPYEAVVDPQLSPLAVPGVDCIVLKAQLICECGGRFESVFCRYAPRPLRRPRPQE